MDPRRLMDWLTALIPFLDAYPMWIKGGIAIWLIFTSVMVILLLFFRTTPQKPTSPVQSIKSQQEPTTQTRGPTATVRDSPNATVYQAGRDLIIKSPSQQTGAPAVIQSLTMEARLTCTIRSGVELPPEKVDLMAWFGGDATLRGSPGDAVLKLVSPIYFQRIGIDRLVVINRFVLTEDSHLRNRPLPVLANYSELILPITTVVNTYAQALDHVRLLEVSIRINGGDPDYQRYSYDVAFEVGKQLTFTIPLSRQQ